MQITSGSLNYLSTIKPDGEYKKYRHNLTFRLYPIPSYTGSTVNSRYINCLNVNVLNYLKKYYRKSSFAVRKIKECYDKCPEEYSCKYLELSICIHTTNSVKNKIIWIEV